MRNYILTTIAFITFFFCSCSEQKNINYPSEDANGNPVVYQNNSFVMYRDSLIEGDKKAIAQNSGFGSYIHNANNETVRPFL